MLLLLHMKRRFVLLVSLLVIALAVQLLGQSNKAWVQPKTPWGDPDLQGVWPAIGVPLQRPSNLGERTTLTDAEFAQRESQAKRQAEADGQSIAASDSRPGIGPPSYWTERGKPTRQTSLIVDPPKRKAPSANS